MHCTARIFNEYVLNLSLYLCSLSFYFYTLFINLLLTFYFVYYIINFFFQTTPHIPVFFLSVSSDRVHYPPDLGDYENGEGEAQHGMACKCIIAKRTNPIWVFITLILKKGTLVSRDKIVQIP